MPDLLVRAVMPHVSGLAEDVSINDFAFDGLTTPATAAAALLDFYTAIRPSGNRVSSYLARNVARTLLGARFDVFAVDTPAKLSGSGPGSALGSPVLSVPWTVSPAFAIEGYPSEVSICLSFRADYGGVAEEVGATRPRARRRGRIFLGPIASNQSTEDGNNVVRPAASMLTDIRDAAFDLGASAIDVWCVWSRADAIFRTISFASTDNAWDTQRRRGESPTSRTEIAV